MTQDKGMTPQSDQESGLDNESYYARRARKDAEMLDLLAYLWKGIHIVGMGIVGLGFVVWVIYLFAVLEAMI